MILLLLVQTAGSQGINFTLDFEEGDLRGWEATGTAFRFQPTLDDNPTARNRDQEEQPAERLQHGVRHRSDQEVERCDRTEEEAGRTGRLSGR